MKIIVAKNAGFCFGVRRAAEIIDKEIHSGKETQTYGPLIHNPEYISFLESKGVTVANNPSEITTNEIVTRTHGVTAELMQELQDKGLSIIDATCPFVSKVQNLAAEYTKKGYQVVILGEENHPEIVSVKSYAPTISVVNNQKNLPDLDPQKEILFISQTTQSTILFKETSDYLESKYPNLKTINTICGATENNQKEVQTIASKADVMIIIGGKESSNTTRLKELAERFTKTYHILNADELDPAWFDKNMTIGIAAGASTPDFSIDKVITRLEGFDYGETV